MPPPHTDLNLKESQPQAELIDLRELPAYSIQWANIVAPFGWTLLCLIGAVILLPFLFVGCIDDLGGQERTDKILDWAKTVLPPVVGFGGALIGYYFGARGGQGDLP